MLIYQQGNHFFIYGKICKVIEVNKNHWVIYLLGVYPIMGIPKKQVLPIHFVNNRYCSMVTQAQNAKLNICGTTIYIKAHFSNDFYFANQFLFQGQMKYYEDQDAQTPERNLFVGIVTKMRMLKNNTMCAQMPINQKDGVKWINLLFRNQEDLDHAQEMLQPKYQDCSMKYQTAAFLTGKESTYHGFTQANVIRFYRK